MYKYVYIYHMWVHVGFSDQRINWTVGIYIYMIENKVQLENSQQLLFDHSAVSFQKALIFQVPEILIYHKQHGFTCKFSD